MEKLSRKITASEIGNKIRELRKSKKYFIRYILRRYKQKIWNKF